MIPGKNMSNLERECHRLWGIDMRELIYHYNQRYPWKKVRQPPY
jgi:hypothetical protein